MADQDAGGDAVAKHEHQEEDQEFHHPWYLVFGEWKEDESFVPKRVVGT